MRVYKLCSERLWREAVRQGELSGAPVDLADGFIHFSTAAQLAETARRHFAGERDLVLLAADAAALGPALRFEPSRGGDLFPHLYAPLQVTAVDAVMLLTTGADGNPVLPAPLP